MIVEVRKAIVTGSGAHLRPQNYNYIFKTGASPTRKQAIAGMPAQYNIRVLLPPTVERLAAQAAEAADDFGEEDGGVED